MRPFAKELWTLVFRATLCKCYDMLRAYDPVSMYPSSRRSIKTAKLKEDDANNAVQ